MAKLVKSDSTWWKLLIPQMQAGLKFTLVDTLFLSSDFRKDAYLLNILNRKFGEREKTYFWFTRFLNI